MTPLWWMIAALATTSYALKAAGTLLLGSMRMPAPLERCVALIPAAVLSALVVKDALSDGRALVVDERAAGIAVALVLVWRRAPLVVVIVGAAAATAALRALGA